MTIDHTASPTSRQAKRSFPVLRKATTTVGWLAVVCFLGAAVVASIPAPTDELLVILGKVRRPWNVSAQLLGAAGVACWVYIFGWAATRADDTPSPRRLRRRIAIVSLMIAAVFLVGRATLIDGLVSTYHVLEPAGSDGCRVVVEERTFLLLGSGAVHALPAGDLTTHEVDDFMADDGYRPVTLGTYSLEWQGNEAHLVLRGHPHAPVFPENFTFRC